MRYDIDGEREPNPVTVATGELVHTPTDYVVASRGGFDWMAPVNTMTSATSGVQLEFARGALTLAPFGIHSVVSFNYSEAVPTPLRLDLSDLQWHKFPIPNTPRREVALCSWKGTLYAAGGIPPAFGCDPPERTGTIIPAPFTSMETIGPDDTKWTVLPGAMNTGRRNATAIGVGSIDDPTRQLLIIGGKSGTGVWGTEHEPDPNPPTATPVQTWHGATGAWSELPSIPAVFERPYATAVPVASAGANHVLVFGVARVPVPSGDVLYSGEPAERKYSAFRLLAFSMRLDAPESTASTRREWVPVPVVDPNPSVVVFDEKNRVSTKSDAAAVAVVALPKSGQHVGVDCGVAATVIDSTIFLSGGYGDFNARRHEMRARNNMSQWQIDVVTRSTATATADAKSPAPSPSPIQIRRVVNATPVLPTLALGAYGHAMVVLENLPSMAEVVDRATRACPSYQWSKSNRMPFDG